MSMQEIAQVQIKFCPDCGCDREHVLDYNPINPYYPNLICSGCMPMTYNARTGVMKVAKSHSFRRCSKCRQVEEFTKIGLTYFCIKCDPEKFPVNTKNKEELLKIKRPSKELV